MIATDQDDRDSGLSISAVERDTGFSKDTLRMWERRYGFPDPVRDQFGERVYRLTEVEKLRTVRRLMDHGHRPGKIMALSLEDLGALATAGETRPGLPAEIERPLELVKTHQIEALRGHLGQMLLRQGLRPFVLDTVAPLNHAVGEAWARGEIQVFEEHLHTEALQAVLHGALSMIQRTGAPPCVLLTTLPGEQHALGVLMAQALLAVEGCACISLGTQTPALDIVLAAESQKADVVALSFSAAFPAAQVWDALEDLRQRLPQRVALWAGGGNAVLSRRSANGVRVVSRLDAIPQAVVDWREMAGN